VSSFQTSKAGLAKGCPNLVLRHNCVDKIPGSDSNLNFFMALVAVFLLHPHEISIQRYTISTRLPATGSISAVGKDCDDTRRSADAMAIAAAGTIIKPYG
jgi:hypothetical protein